MTLYGPDGSTYQNGIKLTEDDWGSIDFLIWRCVTEGGALDNTWLWAKAQAEAHNKPFLAYSFLSADPRNLDEAVERIIIDKTIPVMCDWEKTGCTTDEMLTWVHDLRAKGYKVPLLYTGQAFWQASGRPTLTGYGFDLVVARYGNQSNTGQYDKVARYNEMNAKYGAETWGFNLGGLRPVFWQFGSRIKWGDRFMDMNVFRGDHTELSKWFKTWERVESAQSLNGPSHMGIIPRPLSGPTGPSTPLKGVDDDMNNTATIWFQNQLHVFQRANDGSLAHHWWDPHNAGNGWASESLGGKLAGAPSAAVTADGKRIDVTCRGMDDGIWQFWFSLDDAKWYGAARIGDWL